MFLPIYVLIIVSVESSFSLRICPTFGDYLLPFNKNCYNDPTTKLNTTQIIKTWGFTSEETILTTEDGFKIVLNRGYQNITKPNAILLVHGIGMNSLGFAYRDKDSLPYKLGLLGYDVYIINCRGTKYSPVSKDFTGYLGFHEMAIYDVRSTINYIKRTTNQKILYIGFSMGTTISYIYSSIFADEAKENVKGIVSLAPVEYLTGAKSFAVQGRDLIRLLMPLIGLVNNEFALGGVAKFCVINSFTMFICDLATAPVFGDDFNQLYTPVLTPRTFTMAFDIIPPATIKHYIQLMDANKFQYFDYGEAKNLKIYNQTTPPLYKMGKIKIPVSYYVGPNDWLASKENAKRSYDEVPIKCGYHLVPHKKWCHSDFVNAKDIYKLLYKSVIQKIDVLANDRCTNSS